MRHDEVHLRENNALKLDVHAILQPQSASISVQEQRDVETGIVQMDIANKALSEESMPVEGKKVIAEGAQEQTSDEQQPVPLDFDITHETHVQKTATEMAETSTIEPLHVVIPRAIERVYRDNDAGSHQSLVIDEQDAEQVRVQKQIVTEAMPEDKPRNIPTLQKLDGQPVDKISIPRQADVIVKDTPNAVRQQDAVQSLQESQIYTQERTRSTGLH